MNKHLLEVLDYYKIKELLKKELFTFSGQEQLKNLQPSPDFNLVEQWQKETSEMRNVLERVGRLPLTPLEKDITSDIKQAHIQDSILNAKTLAYIAVVLECFHHSKEFFDKLSKTEFPLLKEKVSAIKYFRVLERTIKDSINEEAVIVDDASPSLKRIRQKIAHTEKKIRDRLESIIRDPRYRPIIQDDIVTIRQGRYVIPVKQQEKGKFPGVVHDKSESGLTIFIEPLAVVELNNELRELFQEEKREEYRILQRLTALIGQNGEDILSNFKYLGELDLINGKAEISRKMNAAQPKISSKNIIRLIQARHPLLKNKVVPIDIELGEKFDTLIITGPNTGGKTVTLKTVGLLHLMAQSGLHIPAAIDSEIVVFRKIFADIGDEQSIEQNLSTFSAHMKNIVSILNVADEHSLVLMDELGAGTDPSEGSALAMAILDFLRKKRARILSTTHHDSLKAYAYLTEGVMNARVEFDEKTLQPTYQLSIGLPGKSCAFSVARRLGLPGFVLRNAEGYLEREKIDLENLIKRMEKDRVQIEDSLKNISREELNAKRLKAELEEKIDTLEREKAKIKLEAYQEAEELINTAQIKAKRIINTLKKKKDGQEKFSEEISALEDLKKEIKKQAEKYDLSSCKVNDLKEGDYIIIKSLGKDGVIVEKNDKKNQYTVQVGNIKLKVSGDDIQKLYQGDLAEREKEDIFSEQAFVIQEDRIEKKASFKNEIDVRHMNAADAEIRVEKYLDDALLLNISPVYIIHGKGKGILRKTVAQLLEKLKYIKTFRYGETYEGGDGVTVVYF